MMENESNQPRVIKITTPMENITSPIMLNEGTEIATIKDKESGIEGTIWVSDGYDCTKHFIKYQGKEYTDWKTFPKELQEIIQNDPAWDKTLGLKYGRDYCAGCFDLLFTDAEGNILIDDTVQVEKYTDSMLRGCLNGSLTSAKSLKAANKMFDKGEIVEMPPKTSEASAEITDFMNPPQRSGRKP